MEHTKIGEFVIFVNGKQNKFLYCNFDQSFKAKNHCEERAFPDLIKATDMVKFRSGLYMVGYANDAIYATMDFKSWYKYSIA